MQSRIEEMITEADFLERMVAWGTARPWVRAIILTSSRTRPDGPVDTLSDYDLILAVTDAESRVREAGWLSDYGPFMVLWGDQSELHGLTTYFRGAIYEDYVKVDYSLWPVELLERIADHPALPDQLDVGYRVLLDKDGGTTRWQPPTYRAHIPSRPTEEEYDALVQEFWWTATYVAKSLWREEMVFAKFCLDYDIKLQAMRRMLEWRLELDHAWSVKPGVFGRGLKRLLPAEIWSELEDTYVGPDLEDNWAALFRTTALFHRVATEVGEALNYVYPQRIEDQVTAYLHEIWKLPPYADARREVSR